MPWQQPPPSAESPRGVVPLHVPHSHEALVHAHQHPHITHNWREGAGELLGEWEHLTALHTHQHEHGALSHAHSAHENVEHEHLGEAHSHHHEGDE